MTLQHIWLAIALAFFVGAVWLFVKAREDDTRTPLALTALAVSAVIGAVSNATSYVVGLTFTGIVLLVLEELLRWRKRRRDKNEG